MPDVLLKTVRNMWFTIIPTKVKKKSCLIYDMFTVYCYFFDFFLNGTLTWSVTCSSNHNFLLCAIPMEGVLLDHGF